MTLILRIFFRLLYHEFAWAYDFVAALVSGGRWKAWVSAVLPLVTGPDVLELGFGPGHLLISLARSGFNVAGVDASRQMVRQAKKNFAPDILSPGLVRGLGLNLPFSSHSFDTVVSTFPTSFIFQPAVLQEVRRVLRPGGSLVILLSAWITDRSLPSRLLAWLVRITGQSPSIPVDEENLLRPFLDTGLDSCLQWVDTAHSRLLFVVATRK